MNDKQDIFSTQSGRWDFTVAIFVILIAGCFICFYSLKNDGNAEDLVEKKQDNRESTEDQVTLSSLTKQEAVSPWKKKRPYRVSKVKRVNPVDKNTKVQASIITDYEPAEQPSPVVSNEKTVKKSEVPSKIPTHTRMVTKDQLENEKDEKNASKYLIQNKKDTQQVVPGDKTLKKVVQNPPPTSKNDVACAAMVGSFKYNRNIQRVLDQLQAMGQPVVQGETSPGLSFVGVPVDCDNKKEQRALIQLLNETFEINSWVKKLK